MSLLHSLRRSDSDKISRQPARKGIRQTLLCLALLAAGALAGFYLFFPDDALRQRLEFEASRQSGVTLGIEALDLSFPPALKGTGVHIDLPAPAARRMTVDRLSLRPLWSSLAGGNPGLAFKANLYGGLATGKALKDGTVEAEAQQLAIREALGGQLPLTLSTTLEQGSLTGTFPPGKDSPTLLELSLAQTQLTGLEALGVKKDTLNLGTIILKGSGKGRSFKVERLESSRGDLEVSASGTVLLAEPLQRSRLNLSLTLRPAAGLDKTIADLLPLFAKPARNGSFNLRLGGTLGAPALR